MKLANSFNKELARSCHVETTKEKPSEDGRRRRIHYFDKDDCQISKSDQQH